MSDYGSIPPPPPPSQPPPPPPLPPPPPSSPYGGYGAQGAPPPNYLVWSILSTVLCCLPLGVASIVFAAQVNSKWAMGDIGGAQVASGRAKKFAIWSAIAWVPFVILFVILRLVAGGLTSTTGSGY